MLLKNLKDVAAFLNCVLLIFIQYKHRKYPSLAILEQFFAGQPGDVVYDIISNEFQRTVAQKSVAYKKA